jgi:glycogen operon protein
VRAYWKGDEGKLPDLATRLTGSADCFNKRGRKPWASVNFITAHDGFTLKDLVSYNDKHNEANGEDNRDGHSNSHSWNHGAEGPTDDQAINSLRQRQMRNLLATLLLSQGTPMILAGDEFGRSQGGNNNSYAQDNDISWMHWQDIAQDDQALVGFVRKLIKLRHALPVLRRSRFFTAEYNAELDVKDITWLSPDGNELKPEQWSDTRAHTLGMILDGRAQATGIKKRGSDATLLLVLNAYHDSVRFTLPEVTDGQEWLLLIDTNQSDRHELAAFKPRDEYEVTGRSLLLFGLKSETLARQTMGITESAATTIAEQPATLDLVDREHTT